MSLVKEEDRFAKNAAVMGEIMIECVETLQKRGYKTTDPGLLRLVASFIPTIDPKRIIQEFITRSHSQCWDAIKEKKEDFFINNAHDIFGFLPAEHVNIFRELFLTRDEKGKAVISQEYKEQIWDLFFAMVKISIKYCYKNPTLIEKDELDRHREKWGVKI